MGRCAPSGRLNAPGNLLWLLLALSGCAAATPAIPDADARIDAAVAAVQAATIATAPGWDDPLAIDISADAAAFGRATGTDPDTTGAATRCVDGHSQIVINPLAADQPAAWLDATLVHELVHVATNSACADTPARLQWAVEGLAESVAAGAHPAAAATNRELVLASLRRYGVPEKLPVIVSDATDYALAQLAADQIRAQLDTAAAADFFDRATHDRLTAAEVSQATAWYRDALTELAASA